MSVYYFTLDHLSYPLLFFGMALALLQLSIDAGETAVSVGGWWGVVRKITAELTLLWFLIALVLGAYISFKVVMTAVGWVAIKIGRPVLFGKEIQPVIDDKLGIGCVFIIIAFVVWTIVKISQRANKRKQTKTNSERGSDNEWYRSDIV